MRCSRSKLKCSTQLYITCFLACLVLIFTGEGGGTVSSCLKTTFKQKVGQNLYKVILALLVCTLIICKPLPIRLEKKSWPRVI